MPSLTTSTIASGGATGSPIKVNRDAPCLLFMDSGWTAATLGFDVSYDGSRWLPLGNLLTDSSGAEVAYTVAADKAYGMDPALFVGAVWFRPRSGAFGSTVPQGAARTLRFQMRQVE